MKLAERGRSLLAGTVWITVALFLAIRGWRHWETFGDGSFPWPWLLLAAVIGGAKGLFVITKSARRIATRIAANPGPQWFWTIYPLQLLLVIPLMILMGWWLRTSAWGEGHAGVVLAVYAGIGAALMVSSRPFFPWGC